MARLCYFRGFVLLVLGIIPVVGRGAVLAFDGDDDGSADGGMEFLQLKLLSKCVSESTENNTLERWIRCVEFVKDLGKKGIRLQNVATVLEVRNTPLAVKGRLLFGFEDSIEGGKQSTLRTQTFELNLLNASNGTLDEHKIWGVEEEGIVRVLFLELESDSYEAISFREPIRLEHSSSDIDAEGWRKECHSVVKYTSVDSSGRFGRARALYFERADRQLRFLKFVLIAGITLWVLRWLSFRKTEAFVKRYCPHIAKSFPCQTSLNGMASKERSSKRKSHKDGSGKAAEQKRGQKAATVSSAFTHLGNAVAVVLTELLRSETLTLKRLKADDLLQVVGACSSCKKIAPKKA